MDRSLTSSQKTDEVKYVLGLGNPIIDISASADTASIEKYGLAFGQTVFANESNVGFFDYLEGQKDVVYIPGGSVTNSIRVTNVILLINM